MNLTAARAAGHSTFISDVPCRRAGHVLRYVNGTHACVPCTRAWNRAQKAALRLERGLAEARRRKDARRGGLPRILSAKEAREQGLEFYYTGKECVNGHRARRRTKNNECVACRKEWDRSPGKRASNKAWQRAHVEQERRRQHKYHVEHRECRRAHSAASYRRNRRKVLARGAARYQRNKRLAQAARAT
jgi:hypothetical protein